jgi:sortase A
MTESPVVLLPVLSHTEDGPVVVYLPYQMVPVYSPPQWVPALPPAESWHRRTRSGALVVGEISLTFGLLAMLLAAYMVYGKPMEISRAQARLSEALDHQWATIPAPTGEPAAPQPEPAVTDGQPASRLHSPAMEARWVVVEGVSQRALRKGPGHYPTSAAPGELGNFAVAGHRIPSIFWDLDVLRPGDPVVVETRSRWYVYRVLGTRIVRPDHHGVLADDPFEPGAPATRRLLTLTTCHPLLNNYERLIVHAELDRATPKEAGRPEELKE